MDRILIPFREYKKATRPKRPKIPLLIDGEAANEINMEVSLEAHLENVWNNRDVFARRYLHLHAVISAAAAVKQAKEQRPVDRSRPLAALNPAARRCLATGKVPDLPALILCPDASGGVGGLEPVFKGMAYPVFILDMLQDFFSWRKDCLQEIATSAAELLDTSLPKRTRMIFGGVGFGGAIAHALTLQAQLSDIGGSRPLVLFEGAAPLLDEGAGVDWITAETRRLLSQVAAQAFDIAVTSGRKAVDKETILVRLSVETNAAGVLRLLGMLCPPSEENGIVWSATVEAVLLRFALLRGFSATYNPDAPTKYSGQATALLQRARGNGCSACLSRGGPDGMWASIVRALHPLAVFVLPRSLLWGEGEVNSLEGTMRYVMKLQDEAFRARANKLVAALDIDAAKLPSPIKDVIGGRGGGEEQEDEEEGPVETWDDLVAELNAESPFRGENERLTAAAAALLASGDGPVPVPGDGNVAGEKEDYILLGGDIKGDKVQGEGLIDHDIGAGAKQEGEGRTEVVQLSEEERAEEDEQEPPTMCIVEPLNSPCTEFMHLEGAWQGPTPVWMVHTECGDILGGQRKLASRLARPCFGLAIGPDAVDGSTSLDELAEHYCAAMESLQPHGPYLILATSSTAGAAVGHAMAQRMQLCGRVCSLIFADCAPSWDAELEDRMLLGGPPLHAPDAIAYALYFFLTEFGALEGGMESFAERIRGAFTAWEQLALVDAYRPDDVEDEDGTTELGHAWDTALYTVLQNCNALKQMLTQRDFERGAPGYNADQDIFKGAAVLLPPRGREGLVMTYECREWLNFDGGRVARIDLPCLHTDCIMTEAGREVTAEMLEGVFRKLEKGLAVADEVLDIVE